MAVKKPQIKKILITVLWSVLGLAAIVLLAAAVLRKDNALCSGIEINISGVSNNFFIDKNDVLKLIYQQAGGEPTGKPVNRFNLRHIETMLEKEVWIKDAELFFDNNNLLQASVEEREPVARIFSPGGNSFYVDSSNMMLPLSDKFSARLPVFTGFPSDAKVLSPADSSLLNDVKHLSILIGSDAFLMGMIEQVDITPRRYFEMMPKIGKQVILFGNADDAAAKFTKLKLFYKGVMQKTGWEKYSEINLQYKNQVLARIRAKEDVLADSLRTLQLMQIMADNAAKMAADSAMMQRHLLENSERQPADTSLIQQSIERDEESGEQVISANAAVDQPLEVKPIVSNPPAERPGVADKRPAESTKPTPPAKPAVKAVKPNKPGDPSTIPLQKPNPKPIEKQKTKPVPKAVMPKN